MKQKQNEEVMVSFRATPEEVKKWRELAKRDDRSLSSWLRISARHAAEEDKPKKAD